MSEAKRAASAGVAFAIRSSDQVYAASPRALPGPETCRDPPRGRGGFRRSSTSVRGTPVRRSGKDPRDLRGPLNSMDRSTRSCAPRSHRERRGSSSRAPLVVAAALDLAPAPGRRPARWGSTPLSCSRARRSIPGISCPSWRSSPLTRNAGFSALIGLAALSYVPLPATRDGCLDGSSAWIRWAEYGGFATVALVVVAAWRRGETLRLAARRGRARRGRRKRNPKR